MDLLDKDKQLRADRRHNKRIAKKRQELLKTLSKDKNEDYKKHSIKRISGNPRKAGLKTAQELRAEEAFDSQLEDADLVSDAAVVEFLVDEALAKVAE